MRFSILAVSVLCCAISATAAARPRTMPDQWLPGGAAAPDIRLAQTGEAVLAGLAMTDPHAVAPLLQGQTQLDVKTLGTDRYGRARTWLFLPGAPEPLQVALLRMGAAMAYDRHAVPKSWLLAEAEARSAQRGLWAAAPQRAENITAPVGTFVRVAGTVRRTYKARDTYYVNFGDDWKTDFSIAIPRKAWRSFGDHMEVVPGTHIEARGALIEQNGPMLTLTRPEQWEIRLADAQ